MVNKKHLQIIRQGVDAWNEWRRKNPELRPNLRGADLHEADLYEADLSEADLGKANLTQANLGGANLGFAEVSEARVGGANLSKANLTQANLGEANLSMASLCEADLRGANLYKAILTQANLYKADLCMVNLGEANLYKADLSKANLDDAVLYKADLSKANLGGAVLTGAVFRGAKLCGADLKRVNLYNRNLSEADLRGAVLRGANLSGADLSGAHLDAAQLISTNLCGATLSGSTVYGASVWDIKVDDQTNQQNLVITPFGNPTITVDDIEVAQFIYLLLNNQAIHKVIDTITSKAVLILGRFSEERKVVLDALREELRKHNYLPIMFDFDPTTNQTIIETVKTLAGMSRFVIADLTDARSVPQELQIIDTHCRTVAVRLIKKRGEPEYGMLDFRNSPWFVKGRYEYETAEELIASIKDNVIGRAEEKVKELRSRA